MVKANTLDRTFSRDVIKFSNPNVKGHQRTKVVSSTGIRGTKFISVYNCPAQKLWLCVTQSYERVCRKIFVSRDF